MGAADPVPSETAATAFNPERRILRLAASTLSKGEDWPMVKSGLEGQKKKRLRHFLLWQRSHSLSCCHAARIWEQFRK